MITVQATQAASSGIKASLARLNASAANVANVNSTGVVTDSSGNASATIGSGAGTDSPVAYRPIRSVQTSVEGGGVSSSYRYVQPSYIPAYNPGSSYADPAGMIAQPNVDLVSERLEQLSAKQAYEANVAVLRTSNEMNRRLVDLEG